MRKLLIIAFIFSFLISSAQEITIYKRATTTTPIDKPGGLTYGARVQLNDTTPHDYFINHDIPYGTNMRTAINNGWAVPSGPNFPKSSSSGYLYWNGTNFTFRDSTSSTSPMVVFDYDERDRIKGRFKGMMVYVTMPDELYILVGDTLNENWSQMPMWLTDLNEYATTASLSNYATTASLSNYATTASLSSYATTASLSSYATQAYVTNAISNIPQDKTGSIATSAYIGSLVTFSTAMPDNTWKLEMTALDAYGTTQPVILLSKSASGFSVLTMVNTNLNWTAKR